jgi:uncharacterized membrane protein
MSKRTTFDWVLEAVALALLILMFVTVAAYWSELPERVPRHYGASGNPDRWGGRGGMWLMPIVSAGLYALLTAGSRYQRPPLVNLPFSVDRSRPEAQKLLLRMTILLKAILMLMNSYISWAGINTALGRAQGLGRAFLPIFLAAVLGPAVFFTLKLWRYRTQ